MNRSVAITGAVLLLLGLTVFATKVLVYDLPLAPGDTRGLWQVELRVTLRGDGRRGSVRALLPRSEQGQVVFDERSASDQLLFSIRSEAEQRVGVWTGRFEGVHEIVYEFRVQSFPVEVPLPSGPGAPPPEALREAYARPSPDHPANDPAVRELLEALDLAGDGDPVARLRSLFAFVAHEVATVESSGDDAVLTLAQREGSPEGKTKLLVTLLRAAGVPARSVRGLALRETSPPQLVTWCEGWLDGHWVPMSPTLGFFGRRPGDLISLGEGSRAPVEATGAKALGRRYFSLREHLRPDEIASIMAPSSPTLAAFSLYRLPLPTQAALRALLLLPLGAFMVAVYRNLIGFPTYGTFMPVLIAFAIRDFALVTGLALVAFVLLLGVVGRLALERLRLLLVPRLAVLLCLVVLAVTGLALLGRGTGSRDLFAGVLFPIVILTMLIERFSITIAEEGLREALIRTGSSVAVAVVIYPVFRSARAEYLMFSFPELVVCVTGLLVWLGGYVGFRLTDLLRFRLLARADAPTEPS